MEIDNSITQQQQNIIEQQQQQQQPTNNFQPYQHQISPQQQQQSQAQYQINPLDNIITVSQLLQKENSKYFKLPTGIPQFDSLLDGGLVQGYLTEVYGEAGSGKTQFGVNLMLNALKNQENQQIDGRALYITFGKIYSQSRIDKLINSFCIKNKLPPNSNFIDSQQLILKSVQKFNDFQEFLNQDLVHYLNNKNLKTRLLVIDEIANLTREEFSNQYKERTQFLIQLTQYLKQLAQEYNICILIINSVVQDTEKQNKIIPAMGPVWSSLVNERFKLWREDRQFTNINEELNPNQQLQKLKQQSIQQTVQRQLKVKFSPRLERKIAHFIIDDEGFK